MVGLVNIADQAKGAGGGYPQLSAEYIIDADPDLIFLGDMKCCGQSPGTVAERWDWADRSAVERGDVIPLDEDVSNGGARASSSPCGPSRVPSTTRGPRRHEPEGPARSSSASGPVRRVPRGVAGGSGRHRTRTWDPLAVLVRERPPGLTEQQATILADLRLPRVIVAGLVGAALSASGAAYQPSSATRSPIPTC